MKKETTLVVLAAGMGSRYGSTKQIDAVGSYGETIVDFSIYDAYLAGFRKIVFIVREAILEDVKAVFDPRLEGKVEVDYVCQELYKIPEKFLENERTKPWGTAHAVLMVKDVVQENFCVINADDFYGRNAFKMMRNALLEADEDSYEFSMVGYLLKNTLSDFGSVSRGECITGDDQYLEGITERTHIEKKGDKIFYQQETSEVELSPNTVVSMNIWGFTPKVFQKLEEQLNEFLEENYLSEKAEYFLPLVINKLIKTNTATIKVHTTDADWMGVTYKEDKPHVVSEIKRLQSLGHYPERITLQNEFIKG